MPPQGLGAVRLTLSWTPPLLPYRLISNPLPPMASRAAEPFEAVSSWGQDKAGAGVDADLAQDPQGQPACLTLNSTKPLAEKNPLSQGSA